MSEVKTGEKVLEPPMTAKEMDEKLEAIFKKCGYKGNYKKIMRENSDVITFYAVQPRTMPGMRYFRLGVDEERGELWVEIADNG